MPSGRNWANFFYVNLAFLIYIFAIFYFNQMEEIKSNWSLYRCNPLYMPFADNVENNFTYCIQNMQTSYMGYLLQPLTYLTSSMTDVLGNFMSEINFVRAMFDKIRTFIATIIQSVFGVFLNLIIEFQKITISIKDLMGKTIGIMVTIMYVLDGSLKTMGSAWNGPSGQMVRTLGKCFHPNTMISLKNGKKVKMKDVELGAILENGSVVESVMKINNKNDKLCFYSVYDTLNNRVIYVTGSHYVFDNSVNKFVKVENYTKAYKTDIQTEWFSCLITNDHKIQIGSELFWDWDDYLI
jgi:hypothetical protein